VKLVIVESPAKAKTIERFLGPDYRVVASYGHIRDLPASAKDIPARYKTKSWARLGVDTDGDFQPVYVVPASSKKYVTALKKQLKDAEEALLATDEDREGEYLSWHLTEVLKPEVPVRRITFHEITRPAILEALESPRDVDEQLVRAQETRRILDRLYGYSLSPVLWKRVRTGLSAGRVQSVALRLIVDRELDRQAFRSSEYWDVQATLRSGDIEFTATLVQVGDRRLATSRDFDSTTGAFDAESGALILDQASAEVIATRSGETVPWTVTAVERKETRQRPAPPFTTSTLQQAASTQLRMSPKKTMLVAQKLYEGVDLGGGDREGLITYMRTDSVTLSDKALGEAGRHIESVFGQRYHQVRRHKTKAKGAQEAHEAIRPTEIRRTPEAVASYLNSDELALYRLIWNRTVASQMADAELDRTTVELTVRLDGLPHVFRANGSGLRFPGFLRVYGSAREDTLLPELAEGQAIGDEASAGAVAGTAAEGHETRPPPRYTEASLVKKLEEEGIGRPSTYNPILSTIQDRGYVLKKSGALVPTYVGMAVVDLLKEHFGHYVDIEFTARMEDALDGIAEGGEDWVGFLHRFYRGTEGQDEGLARQIESELPKIDYPRIMVGEDPESGAPIFVRIGRTSAYLQAVNSKADEPLGLDEETGAPIFLKVGRFGPYLQLGEGEDGERPRRVSLPEGVDPEDVTPELAGRLLSLPRTVGVDPATGHPVTAGLGRYGPYVERAKTYRSVADLETVFQISLDEAVALLNAKRGSKTVLRELGPHPETGADLKILSGRYGPYVTDGTLNGSLPKGVEPGDLSMEEAVELLVKAAERKAARGGRRRPRSS
jgi:DNA topoisomerase-1